MTIVLVGLLMRLPECPPIFEADKLCQGVERGNGGAAIVSDLSPNALQRDDAQLHFGFLLDQHAQPFKVLGAPVLAVAPTKLLLNLLQAGLNQKCFGGQFHLFSLGMYLNELVSGLYSACPIAQGKFFVFREVNQ